MVSEQCWQRAPHADGLVAMQPKELWYGGIVRRNGAKVAVGRNAQLRIIDENNRTLSQYTIPYSAVVEVEDEQVVKKDQLLFNWDPYTASIVSTYDGVVEYVDIVENVTMREELDDATGLKQRVIIESRMRNLSPAIRVLDKEGNVLSSYMIPTLSLIHI